MGKCAAPKSVTVIVCNTIIKKLRVSILEKVLGHDTLSALVACLLHSTLGRYKRHGMDACFVYVQHANTCTNKSDTVTDLWSRVISWHPLNPSQEPDLGSVEAIHVVSGPFSSTPMQLVILENLGTRIIQAVIFAGCPVTQSSGTLINRREIPEHPSAQVY